MSELSKKLDEAFSRWDKPDAPGFAIGLVQDGELIYKRGFGMADLEHDVPITPDSVFRIGSISKQFTAMCTALLEEKGEISFDDSVRRYIPELPEYANPITLRHLIHHTSGIRNYGALFSLQGRMDWEDHEKLTESYALEIICNQRNLNFLPGEQYQYSNSSYFLLGLIAKRVSGMSLREFAKKHIFDPLGMNSTHFHDDHRMIVKNRACGYAQRDDGGFELAMSKTEIVGDGCVFSTIEDLAKWDSNFYDNKLGGGMELMKRFLTPGKLNNGESNNYAFGVVVTENLGRANIMHGGGYAGYAALLSQYPVEKFSFIFLTNAMDYIWHHEVYQIVLGHRFPQKIEQKESEKETDEKFITLPEDKLERFVGTYIRPTGWMFTISREGTKLFMDALGWEKFRTSYAPISQNTIKSVEGPLEFKVNIDESQKVTLIAKINGVNPCDVVDFSIPIKKMKDYEGIFYNDDINSTYNLHLEEDRLYCKFPSSPPKDFHLFEFSEDVFIWSPIPNEYLKLKFIRNENEEVTGFWLDAPEHVSNFKFEKQV